MTDEQSFERNAAYPAPRTVEGVYEDGVIRLAAPLDLPANTRLSLRIAGDAATVTPAARTGFAAALRGRVDALILALVLGLYGLTRLVGLERFPIYFFCDEAIQPVLARALLERGLRDEFNTLLPAFFYNADKWSLGLSVYVHALSVALFGVSVTVARVTTLLVSVLALLAVCLTLKLVFNNRFWWLGGLALAAMPAWFLHTRTAFETTMMVAFYACFLCCYLLYRTRAPGYIVPALLFGAATFYTYTNGQAVMLVSGTLLLLSDLRYHLGQPGRIKLMAGGTAALMAVPYMRFRLLQPEALVSHLRTVDSFLFYDLSPGEKLARFLATYGYGLSPAYWFLPNETDLVRHRMGTLAHMPLFLLPFVLLGVLVCLRGWRSPIHRAVLIALLAAPFGSAIAGIFVTRSLAMVVPAALLFALGFAQFAEWLKPRVSARVLAGTAGAMLALYSLWLPYTSLRDGPTWFGDYGLYGMQYGAPQVFGAIEETLQATPDADIRLSPNWANNSSVFPAFFLTPAQQSRVRMESIDDYLLNRRDLSPQSLYIMIPEEYEKVRTDPKLIVAAPERILPYPDGRPGFYFVRLAYAPDADRLFEQERIERQRPQQEVLTLDGQQVNVTISRLDSGRPVDLFDGDTWTLARTLEANPMVVKLEYPQPRAVSALTATLTSMDCTITVTLFEASGETRTFARTYLDQPRDPTVELPFTGGPYQISAIQVEVLKLNDDDPHVHVRELVLE
jgi:hypothetical protein